MNEKRCTSENFQFPQSGISFCDSGVGAHAGKTSAFQFPQSGISFCDLRDRPTVCRQYAPFNSLNLGFPSATWRARSPIARPWPSFQFPQSGISFCDRVLAWLALAVFPSFNSLNLGFPSATSCTSSGRTLLMPFFQFPQSGISFCDGLNNAANPRTHEAFNSLNLGFPSATNELAEQREKTSAFSFNSLNLGFPSATQDTARDTTRFSQALSIPSIWDFLLRRRLDILAYCVGLTSFNSLNLGFPSATHFAGYFGLVLRMAFQFPQSGISFCDPQVLRPF